MDGSSSGDLLVLGNADRGHDSVGPQSDISDRAGPVADWVLQSLGRSVLGNLSVAVLPQLARSPEGSWQDPACCQSACGGEGGLNAYRGC